MRKLAIFALLLGCNSDYTSPKIQFLEIDEVETWMYQIQDLDNRTAINELDALDYDMLVVEPGNNMNAGAGGAWDTRYMVDALQFKPCEGSRRILLAYIDIGQAEEWRTYWQAGWGVGTPDWIVTTDPDGWSGNYPVAYWDQEWRDIWLADGGELDKLWDLGFDGVFLDWVEAYDDDDVAAKAVAAGLDPGLEMIKFIEDIRDASPGRFIVAQNAPYLIDSSPARYAEAVDAVAMESTWWNGEGDCDWADPCGGDRHTQHGFPGWSTAERLVQYDVIKSHDLPVYSVDYSLIPANATQVYTDAGTAGLIPLVSRTALSQPTNFPPWGW